MALTHDKVIDVTKWLKAVKAAGNTRGMVRLAHISKLTHIQSKMTKEELEEAKIFIPKLTNRDLKSLIACGTRKEIRAAVLDEILTRSEDE